MKKRTKKKPPWKAADAAAVEIVSLANVPFTRAPRAVANMPRLAVCLCVSMFARGQQGQRTEPRLLSQISPAF